MNFTLLTNSYSSQYFENDSQNRLQCFLCGTNFLSVRGLRLHEGKIHSTSEKNIKCRECQKLFNNKYSLNIHIKQVHDRSTRKICEKCGKVVYNKYMLKIHTKKAHPPENAIN